MTSKFARVYKNLSLTFRTQNSILFYDPQFARVSIVLNLWLCHSGGINEIPKHRR